MMNNRRNNDVEVFNDHDVSRAFETVISSIGFKVVEPCDVSSRIHAVVNKIKEGIRVPGCVSYGVVRNEVKEKNSVNEMNGVMNGGVSGGVSGTVVSRVFNEDNTHSAYILTTYVNSKHIRDLTVSNDGRFVNKNKLLLSNELRLKLLAHLNDYSKSFSSKYNASVYVISKPSLENAPKWVTPNHILFKFIVRLPNFSVLPPPFPPRLAVANPQSLPHPLLSQPFPPPLSFPRPQSVGLIIEHPCTPMNSPTNSCKECCVREDTKDCATRCANECLKE
jgi:hypothetical protein